MSIKATVSNMGTHALRTVIIIGIFALLFIFIGGGVIVAGKILPWLMLLSTLILGINIFILLPLAVIPPTRPWAGHGFFLSSYIFGLTGWLMGLILTWGLWGGLAVVIGLFIVGIGVIPIGMLAALFSGMWIELGLLVLAVVLTFGLRIIGMRLSENG